MSKIVDGNYDLDWVKLQLTRCCNLKCSFCSQADFRDNNTIDADLFIKQVLDVAKPRLLILTGGEPLCKPTELFKILGYCRDNNIETGLFTNATLVTPEIARKLKDNGLNWARVSLNGYNQEVHEHSYPKDSFLKTINGIGTLQEAGVYVKIRTTVTKNNQFYIEELINLAIAMNIKELDFRPYLELGDCNPHQDNSLNSDELIENCAKLIHYKEKYKDSIQIKLLPNWFDFLYSDLLEGEEKYEFEVCNCGRKYLYIDSLGNYRACAGHRLLLGNMEESNIEEIWKNSRFLKQTRNYSQSSYCQECPKKIECHMANCHLINYEAYGSFEEGNPCCPILNTSPESAIVGYEKVLTKYKKCQKIS